MNLIGPIGPPNRGLETRVFFEAKQVLLSSRESNSRNYRGLNLFYLEFWLSKPKSNSLGKS